MGKIYILYTTIDSEAGAQALARKAVETGLVACVNISSKITSVYKWEDNVNETLEYSMLFKASISNIDKIVSFIKTEHPYDVPCILYSEVNSSLDFVKYIEQA